MKIKNKIYTMVLVFGLIMLSLAVFFIIPFLNKIVANSDNLSLKKKSIASFRNQAVEIENFQKSYSEYEPNLKKIDQMFVDLKNPVGFIEFLEKTALESGLEPEISLSPYSSKENESAIVFQFFSTGDFLKILKFTKALESGPYLIRVENLSVKSSDKQDASGKSNVPGIVDAAFLIKAFAGL